MKKITLPKKLPLVLSLLLLFFASCNSVKLIADYNEANFTALNEVQERITGFFVDMETSAGTANGSYANHAAFYREVKTKIQTLKIRAGAVEKNEILTNQLTLLDSSIYNLEKLDKAGIKPDEVKPLKNAFESSLTAIIKLQLALKRGKK